MHVVCLLADGGFILVVLVVCVGRTQVLFWCWCNGSCVGWPDADIVSVVGVNDIDCLGLTWLGMSLGMSSLGVQQNS